MLLYYGAFLEQTMNLPEASFKEMEDYNICDAPPRPNAYIRFIEKSTEELDGEVRYTCFCNFSI